MKVYREKGNVFSNVVYFNAEPDKIEVDLDEYVEIKLIYYSKEIEADDNWHYRKRINGRMRYYKFLSAHAEAAYNANHGIFITQDPNAVTSPYCLQALKVNEDRIVEFVADVDDDVTQEETETESPKENTEGQVPEGQA